MTHLSLLIYSTTSLTMSMSFKTWHTSPCLIGHVTLTNAFHLLPSLPIAIFFSFSTKILPFQWIHAHTVLHKSCLTFPSTNSSYILSSDVSLHHLYNLISHAPSPPSQQQLSTC